MLLGLRIVSHSIRQLFGNPSAALRIFLLPTMLTFAFMNYFQLNCLFSGPAILNAIHGGYFPWLATTALFVFSEALFLWSAVAWHRFVLLNEAPTLPFMPPHVGRILAYFGRMLWPTLLVFVPMFAIAFATGFAIASLGNKIFAPTDSVIRFTSLAIGLPVTALLLRLMTSLPATALGMPGSVKQAWTATRSQRPTLLIVAAGMILFKDGTAWLMQVASVGTETAAGAAIRVTIYAMGAMLALSFLTTLYGYYIEKRPLT